MAGLEYLVEQIELPDFLMEKRFQAGNPIFINHG